MAIKLALAAALLVALLALSGATTFTTSVTTTSFDVDESHHQPQRQQCSQMLQGRQFRACQSYLTRQNVLEMATDNPQAQSGARECCDSLKEIERQQQQCGCEAIRQAVRQVQERGQMRESEQVYQKARTLPRTCGLRSQECQLNVVFV